MDSQIQSIVQEIHDSPTMAVIVVAGAGSHAIDWLLAVGGASRTILEATVPYSSPSFAEYLGYEPDQSVNARTASDLARAAYKRAVKLRQGGDPVVGIACTATIATDRPKRGEHRCHIAAWSGSGVTTYSLQFVKGMRDRSGEESIASKLVLRALSEASAIEFPLAIDLDSPEQIEVEKTTYEDGIKSLLANHVGYAVVHGNGSIETDRWKGGGILPGSFNPFHRGHEKLAAAASEMLGTDVTYELSITNVDKPTLEESEIRERVAQFAGRYDMAVTRAHVFYEKARLFPGCTFVIGSDTLIRLVDPKYYDGSEVKMFLALEEIKRQGCHFLVAGRLRDGVFESLNDISIPSEFGEMFTAIPESVFRDDISSTELRMAGKTP